MTDAQWMAQHALFEQMIMALMDCPVPVIAAINGASYAGGFEMTLAAISSMRRRPRGSASPK